MEAQNSTETDYTADDDITYCSTAKSMKEFTHPLDGNKLKLWELNENVDAVFKLQEADMT
jgi:hypothetical protein